MIFNAEKKLSRLENIFKSEEIFQASSKFLRMKVAENLGNFFTFMAESSGESC